MRSDVFQFFLRAPAQGHVVFRPPVIIEVEEHVFEDMAAIGFDRVEQWPAVQPHKTLEEFKGCGASAWVTGLCLPPTETLAEKDFDERRLHHTLASKTPISESENAFGDDIEPSAEQSSRV